MITPYSNIISVTTLEALLLDTYSGAAAAYSLRKLSASYTGSAIRVRRASDNTEQDIGFVNNELDTSTLTSFCSGTNGFVKTWYDQSGNGKDATQTAVANQPQIVSIGSVVLDNGKPTILFDGSNDVLQKNSFGFPTTNISIVKVGSRIGSAGNDSIGYTTNGGLINVNGNTRIGFDGRPNGGAYISTAASSVGTTAQILQFNIYDGSNMKASVDGGSFDIVAISANPILYGSQDLDIAAITSLSAYYNCNNSEFIIWATDESINKTGIETNINANYQIYWDGSQTSLLDTYSGSAAAYSLRALSSAYTGPLVRVRRASDNAEQDIYAKYDGTLNVSALESFCSGTDGFVKTWYDQSGNGRDATQTTAANQPQIVSSGSVITKGGKACIQISTSNVLGLINLQTNAFVSSISQPVTVFSAFNQETVDNRQVLFDGRANQFGVYYFITEYQQSAGTLISLSSTTTGQKLAYNLFDTTSSELSVNNSTLSTGNNGSNQLDGITIGNLRGVPNPIVDDYMFIGQIHEMVFYPSDQSSNRTGIESNINNFYSIY